MQDISEIPADLKQIYKTVWEIKMRSLIDMAAERGAFICQSQSLNLFMKKVNYGNGIVVRVVLIPSNVWTCLNSSEAHIDAFLCVGKGTENRDVLSQNHGCR